MKLSHITKQRLRELRNRHEYRLLRATSTEHVELRATDIGDITELIGEVDFLRTRIHLALSALDADKTHIASNIPRRILE